MASWPHGDPSVVVRGILATAPYRHTIVATTDKPSPNVLEILWNWFREHVLRPLFHWLDAHLSHAFGGAAGKAGSVLVYAIIGIAALVLAFAIYRLVVAFARSGSKDSIATGERLTLADLPSSAQWRARAAEAARAGDYGRAIAALFTAALATLDERAIVAFDATRTPGEYRRLVRRARATAADPFNDLSGRFVRAAYAEVVTTADDYAQAERAFAAFEPMTASV